MKEQSVTDVNIITKQIVINEHMSSHLLPITADEKIIDLIQSKLTRLEELEKKEVPMKVSYVRNYSGFNNMETGEKIMARDYKCPSCNSMLQRCWEDTPLYTNKNYCHVCGQKLDWSDEK